MINFKNGNVNANSFKIGRGMGISGLSNEEHIKINKIEISFHNQVTIQIFIAA